MTVVVAPNVTQTLLRYYKALITNPKYKISFERAWEKYSTFHKYIYGGFEKDISKARFCPFVNLGQSYNNTQQPKFPNLKYLTYCDESKFKWYIAFVYNNQKGQITVTKLKAASNVKCESKQNAKIILKESQLCSIIRETLKSVLLTA